MHEQQLPDKLSMHEQQLSGQLSMHEQQLSRHEQHEASHDPSAVRRVPLPPELLQPPEHAHTTGASCTPANDDDVASAMCKPWCSSFVAQTHCSYCACQLCAFCEPSQRPYSPSQAKSDQLQSPAASTGCTAMLGGRVRASGDRPWCFHFLDRQECESAYVYDERIPAYYLCFYDASAAGTGQACQRSDPLLVCVP